MFLTIVDKYFTKKYEKQICYIFKAQEKCQSCTFSVIKKWRIHLIYLHLV